MEKNDPQITVKGTEVKSIEQLKKICDPYMNEAMIQDMYNTGVALFDRGIYKINLDIDDNCMYVSDYSIYPLCIIFRFSNNESKLYLEVGMQKDSHYRTFNIVPFIQEFTDALEHIRIILRKHEG